MSEYFKLQEYLKTNQSTWLVTGVGGFIGSNLLEKLLILNQKVIGLENFDTGYQHNINLAIEDANYVTGKNLSKNFNLINGDIKILDDCKKACQNVDYVLHQAALGSVPRSIENPISTNKANIDGFLNMLVASKDACVKRFVYASSSSIYGDLPDLPKIEDKVGNPLSPYAATKLVNELYANVFAKTYGIKTIGLRYFNIYGKRQDPKGVYAAVIPLWINSLLSKNEVFINGDGETSRDFCHIDNSVQANILAATTENPYALNQVYNVAVGDSTSLNKLYEEIRNQLSINLNYIAKINPKYNNFREGDVRHSLADIRKAKALLNYEPTLNLKEGLKETLKFYINSINKN